MKPRTQGFWLIVATVGLLALLPLSAAAGMTTEEVKAFAETKVMADQGDAQAQSKLGLCYYNGVGVAKDFGQAVAWYRKSAEQGNAKAQSRLGYCYANGEGVPKDDRQAASWYLKASEGGDAVAQLNLGVCFFYGNGVARNLGGRIRGQAAPSLGV